MIDRTYNEAGRFQWAREVAVNAVEAGASKIVFGLERNGIEASGTYRRYIADNGSGMNKDDLVTFFRTLGGSSKAVGGAHENYGIGAKIALLPWNTAGLIVASWQGGEGNVIWAKADDETGEYGLRKVEYADEITDVWPTGPDPELGFDLEDSRPDWLEDHGTVLLLLGDVLDQHTIRNDSRRDLKGRSALREYLDRRFWCLPDSVEIRVEEMPSDDAERWPGRPDGESAFSRAVASAERNVKQKADHSGVVEIKGTKLHWFLNRSIEPGERPFTRERGFIAALYKGELYEHKTEHYDYRSFGVAHKEVRDGLTIIVEPPLADDDRRNGAFPEGDRNSLLWNEGDGENRPLPWNVWGEGFAENMPEEIRAALDANRRGGHLEDEDYKQRLADLFGERFKMSRLEAHATGPESVAPTAPRRRSEKSKTAGGGGGRQDDKISRPDFGRSAGDSDAQKTRFAAALPRWEACGPDDVGTGMLAAWDPRNPAGPTLLINVQHSVIKDQIAYWTEQYPHAPETVTAVVEEVYGIAAVAAVAHSEQLKAVKVDRRTIEEKVRSEEALTLSMLGLMLHDLLIGQRLGGKLGRRRTPGSLEEVASGRSVAKAA
jgi:hypothetical protein